MKVSQPLPRSRLLKSSRGKKRAAYGLLLASLAVTAAERRRPIQVPRLPRMTFSQLDVEFDGDRHQKSSWGAVDLRFLGSEQVLYFNLTVQSGNSGSPVWRIQNIPVLSREGPNVRQTTTFHFNLANTPGDRVPSLDYGFELTESTLTGMPELRFHAHVDRRDYRIDTGYGGRPIIFVPPPETLVGGAGLSEPPEAVVGAAAAGGPCSHDGFPNIDVGKDECVPGAVSNSLNWMNELYGLGISVNDITLEAMKGATGWKRENKGCRFDWPGPKRQYLEAHEIPVSTEEVDGFRVGRILEAVCAGCDVEIGINEHCVAVTGAQKLENGNYSFDLTHDSDQNGTGGTITETAIYDNALGQFQGNPWLQNKTTEFIVIECPFGSPTPTPSPSETPSPSPTHRPSTPTRTATPSHTPGSPTATPSFTGTASPTPTSPTPTSTATPSPTPPSPTPTATPVTPTPPPPSPTPGSPTPTVTPTPTPPSSPAARR